MQPFVQTLHARGVLSFAPDSEPLLLTPLNVLIGPNGSGKSNLIEIFELLKALPTDLAAAIRESGGISEWLWKGEARASAALWQNCMRARPWRPNCLARARASKPRSLCRGRAVAILTWVSRSRAAIRSLQRIHRAGFGRSFLLRPPEWSFYIGTA